METKDWNRVLDRYLSEDTMFPDDYAQLNIEQRYCIQEIKKSFKRLKNKQNEQN